MNYLIFLAGCGAGSIACCIAFIFIIGKAASNQSRSLKQSEDYNKVTAELMRERNELDRKKIKAIESLSEKFNQL